jgi:hypothetical protein
MMVRDSNALDGPENRQMILDPRISEIEYAFGLLLVP